MEPINTVKIGFKTYVLERPNEIITVGGECCGRCSYHESKILIAGKLEQHEKNHTLIHEMIHCICDRFSLRELNKDEQTVDLLALGIYEAITDNPHIFFMNNI